jgi:hypothetical protein
MLTPPASTPVPGLVGNFNIDDGAEFAPPDEENDIDMTM